MSSRVVRSLICSQVVNRADTHRQVCLTCDWRTKMPWFSSQIKQRFPWTVPLFLPFASSSATPIHLPVNTVKCTHHNTLTLASDRQHDSQWLSGRRYQNSSVLKCASQLYTTICRQIDSQIMSIYSAVTIIVVTTFIATFQNYRIVFLSRYFLCVRNDIFARYLRYANMIDSPPVYSSFSFNHASITCRERRDA